MLAEAGADVLALETIPDADEAEALVNIVRSLGVSAWLSYTIDGAHTRAGQPLADAFAVAAGVPEIVAVGVNCCAPAEVLPAIEPASATDKPVIVYPNSGERWDATRRDGSANRGFRRSWRRAGSQRARGWSAGAAGCDRTTSPSWRPY